MLSQKNRATGSIKAPVENQLRLGDTATRIRGMNIAAAAAREYLKEAGRPRTWPGHVARLVDANLSLLGQRIMARVRKIERSGNAGRAEQAFCEGMREVGIAAAKEYLGSGQ
ncbi:MAG: hypothetical protein ACRD19_06335 [Terriglobia bacterium]